MKIEQARKEARIKALDSLAKYKFMMFGYHAALWVTLNKMCAIKQPNPFLALVKLALKIKE